MKIAVLTAVTLFVFASSLPAAEWYETAGFRKSDVLQSACAGFADFPSRKPLPTIGRGTVAAGHIWVEPTEAEYKAIAGTGSEGIAKSSVEVLSGSDAKFFAKKYEALGDTKVPFLVSLVAGLVLPDKFGLVAGTNLTLLDAMVANSSSVETAKDVGLLMKHGGKIVNYRAIMPDNENHPWFFDQSYFDTTVNGQPVSFLLCETRYPLKRP